jgi:hypothetical protein
MALRETKTSDTRELSFEHLLVHFIDVGGPRSLQCSEQRFRDEPEATLADRRSARWFAFS